MAISSSPGGKWLPHLSVAFGKLVVMPLLGVASLLALRPLYPLDEGLRQSLFFAMLVVTCSPTAGNIAATAGISRDDREELARCVFVQCCFAPVMLTLWAACFLSIVSVPSLLGNAL